jgi:hypothetical protein
MILVAAIDSSAVKDIRINVIREKYNDLMCDVFAKILLKGNKHNVFLAVK